MIYTVLNAISGRALPWLLVLALGAAGAIWLSNLFAKMNEAEARIEVLSEERDVAREVADEAARRAEQAFEAERRAADALQDRLDQIADAPREECYARELPEQFWEE